MVFFLEGEKTFLNELELEPKLIVIFALGLEAIPSIISQFVHSFFLSASILAVLGLIGINSKLQSDIGLFLLKLGLTLSPHSTYLQLPSDTTAFLL